MKCHICESETDFTCVQCDEPVCEDCCVVPTYLNQIDYALCVECGDSNDCRRADKQEKDWEREEKIKEEKEKKSKARKETYWKPENIAKRRVLKAERKRLKAEQARQRMADSVRFVVDMFRGM